MSASFTIWACTTKQVGDDSDGQTSIREFDGVEYGFSLDVKEGQYVPVPDIEIPGNDIKETLDGKKRNVNYLGVVSPDGMNLKNPSQKRFLSSLIPLIWLKPSMKNQSSAL